MKELEQLKTELRTREKQQKNKNRRVEDMKLMMADMSYLRRKIDLLKAENAGIAVASNPIASMESADTVSQDIMTSGQTVTQAAASAANAASAEAAAASGGENASEG